jgi:hypothetical protein
MYHDTRSQLPQNEQTITKGVFKEENLSLNNLSSVPTQPVFIGAKSDSGIPERTVIPQPDVIENTNELVVKEPVKEKPEKEGNKLQELNFPEALLEDPLLCYTPPR